MISLLPDSVKTILCIGAHADDIEIGCGGTLLKLLEDRNDLNIHWVVLSGDERRTAEAERSAARFLAKAQSCAIEVKGFRDASFPYTEARGLKDYFSELSHAVQPDLIFTHRREDMHQDHRFVAELSWQHFRNHMIFEYEIPKYEGDLGQPSVFVPLPEDLVEAKIAATIAEFESQHDKPWFTPDTLRALMRIRGVECQSPSGFAEAFHCRKMIVS